MQKFVVGIVAILCVHIGFVMYFSTPDTAESARIKASQTLPVPRTTLSEPVPDDQIIIARGTTPEPEIDERLASGTKSPSKDTTPHSALTNDRNRADLTPKVVKIVNISWSRDVPKYSTPPHAVQKNAFPVNASFIAPSADENDFYSAKIGTERQKGRRSFLSKVGSIVKKPYDGLKAIASWLR